jgi:hypothetical protein
MCFFKEISTIQTDSICSGSLRCAITAEGCQRRYPVLDGLLFNTVSIIHSDFMLSRNGAFSTKQQTIYTPTVRAVFCIMKFQLFKLIPCALERCAVQ